MSDDDKEYFAEWRSLQKFGNSIAVTLPKEELRRQGVLDEDGELVDDAEARAYIETGEERKIGAEVPVSD